VKSRVNKLYRYHIQTRPSSIRIFKHQI